MVVVEKKEGMPDQRESVELNIIQVAPLAPLCGIRTPEDHLGKKHALRAT
jgi:hypothetical protein